MVPPGLADWLGDLDLIRATRTPRIRPYAELTVHHRSQSDMCAGRLSHVSEPTSCELFQQRLGLLQVGSVEALAEPFVDWREQVVGFPGLALLLPEPTKAHRCPQLQRFGLLAAGDVEGLLKTGFSLYALLCRAN